MDLRRFTLGHGGALHRREGSVPRAWSAVLVAIVLTLLAVGFLVVIRTVRGVVGKRDTEVEPELHAQDTADSVPIDETMSRAEWLADSEVAVTSRTPDPLNQRIGS